MRAVEFVSEGWKSAAAGAALGGLVGGMPGAAIGAGIGHWAGKKLSQSTPVQHQEQTVDILSKIPDQYLQKIINKDQLYISPAEFRESLRPYLTDDNLIEPDSYAYDMAREKPWVDRVIDQDTDELEFVYTKAALRVNFYLKKMQQQELNELTFRGSQCTKDCSGHAAGYEWSKRKGGVDAASWSPSFNKGAALFKNGY